MRFVIEEGIEIGDNEIAIVANRDWLGAGFGAIQATVYWNDIPIAKQTITAAKDVETVTGTLLFHIDDTAEPQGHQH